MSSPRRHDAFHQAGLSLLETLVAFTLLAGMIGILIQVYARGAMTDAHYQAASEAIQVAESLLDSAAAAGAVTESSGRTGDYHWRIRRVPQPDWQQHVDDRQGMDTSLSLQRIEVVVRWQTQGRDRQLRLITLQPLAAS